MDDRWLSLVKRVQVLAKIGLYYTPNHFDRDRYEELETISLEMLSLLSDEPPKKIAGLIGNERGYVTPKTDVRAVILKGDQILMVKESQDGCWSIPGGYADYGFSPAEIAVKEAREETGLEVKATRLLAVFDKKNHDHPPTIFHCYKIFIQCEVLGGELRASDETPDVAFQSLKNLPPLSVERLTRKQLETVFALAREESPTVLFD